MDKFARMVELEQKAQKLVPWQELLEYLSPEEQEEYRKIEEELNN